MEAFSNRPSLYRLLAIAPPVTPSGSGPGPGTIETHAIETIDNDRALSLMTAIGGACRKSRGGPPHPGTAITATIETMDNDTGAISLHVTGVCE